jgi:hypothetical protein
MLTHFLYVPLKAGIQLIDTGGEKTVDSAIARSPL